MDKLLARYSPRERLVVGIAALALLGVAIHALVIEPYQLQLQTLQEDLEQQRADLEWMRSAVLRLPVGGVVVVSDAEIDGSLANFVDQAVRQQGLGNQLASMSPVGDDVIRMRLAAVDFNRLISLIAGIYSSGLEVRDLRVTATDTAGLVDSSLVLFRS